MGGVHFADGFDRPETIAFGLGAPQLGVVASGAFGVYLLAHASGPAPARVAAAVILAACSAALGWGRLAERPLLSWAWLMVRFLTSPRRGGDLVAVSGAETGHRDGSSPIVQPEHDAEEAARVEPDDAAPTAETPGADHAQADAPVGGVADVVDSAVTDADGGPPCDEPPWARWLGDRRGWTDGMGARTTASEPFAPRLPAAPRDAAPQVAEPERPEATRGLPVTPASSPCAAAPASPASEGVADGNDPGRIDSGRSDGDRTAAVAASGERTGLVRRWRSARRPPVHAGDHGDTASPPRCDPAAALPDGGGLVDVHRPAVVLLPEPPRREDRADAVADADPSSAANTGYDDDEGDDPDVSHGDVDVDDEVVHARGTVVPLRVADDDNAVLHVADTCRPVRAPAAMASSPGDAPVFVGGARRVAFYSLNGGSGRTTLATEVAAMLAARGMYRPAPDEPAQRLRVALLDLDLRCPNVAMRLGVPHPTILDYLLAADDDDGATVHPFLVEHSCGVRALLGPPKPLSVTGRTLETERLTGIIRQLERDGTQFIVVDLAADLGPVTTTVLDQVHDIYVVIRAAATGVQDAYRTTEALRRLGFGHKLRYVVNRARGRFDLDEVMGDLGGRVIVTVPDDPRIEAAENAHRLVALDGGGPAATAIARLAADVYPALRAGRGRRRLGLWERLRRG